MSDLLSAKTAVEIGVSAVVLGAFYTYWPGNFYYILLVVSASWIGYLINREKRTFSFTLTGGHYSNILRNPLLFFKAKNPVLSPTEWKKFPLTHKTRISHNVSLYRFALPNPDDILGLPVGQHISVQAEIDGKTVQRSYTPTSSDDDCGYFELLIKTYPNGLISTYVDQLEIGQPLTVKGPKGQFKYQPDLVRALGMIAGGTGITPMLQIIRAILKDPADETQVNLIFANVNLEDILLKDELDALAKDHENFNVYYVLNNPPEGWTGGTGYVTEKIIKEYCPAPAPDVKILLCGPPPMVTAMGKTCELLGYNKPRALSKLEDQVFKF